jgi:Domain of unknown function (DUF1802)
MSQGISLSTALCLSESDNTALISGQSIAALSRAFINSAQRFALCSVVGDTSVVEAWAEHNSCRMYVNPDDAQALSWHTIWPKEFIQGILQEKNRIFLNTLRVYRLDKPIEIEGGKAVDKIGGFIKLPKSIDVNKIDFVLSEATFIQRLQNLQKLSPPEHPELKVLQAAIAPYIKEIPIAQAFNDDLQCFLGWAEPTKSANIPEWVKEITSYGKSKEGSLFEKRVREGLRFLGFSNNLKNPKISLDPKASGGAGGLDFYCEKPYPVVGECKASQLEKVNDNKDGAPSQLIKLGQKLLKPEGFRRAIKIIIAPGKLTPSADETANGNEMNIMRPETLQRLVELKVAHSGSIDLLKLKTCLEDAPFGVNADTKVNQFIDRIEEQIKVRSHIVLRLKKFLQDKNADDVKFDVYYGIFCGSNPPQDLTERELHDILIELSSPLAGHLGRIKCSGSWREAWRGDRFYWLRDLPPEVEELG